MQHQESKVEQEEEQQVLNPSKAKFNKYLEDIKQREQQISGTFGEGQNQFEFVSKHKVDEAINLENVTVFQDHSAILTQEDINYNQIQLTRVFKM